MNMKTEKGKIQAVSLIVAWVVLLALAVLALSDMMVVLLPVLGLVPTILLAGAVSFGLGAIQATAGLKLIEVLAERGWFV